MICCVTSSFIYYDETLSTLKYATQARKIRNPAKKNIKDIDSKSEATFKKIIRALREQVQDLKDQIHGIRSRR
jgi:polyhydroxyalkanoate synthesis regulator phasin